MNRRFEIASPVPSVLVVGHFPAGRPGASDASGFASVAWQKIEEIYQEDNWSRGPRIESLAPSNQPAAETIYTPGHEPLLKPIKLDDQNDAGSSEFKRSLNDLFQEHDVWGIISCCTAENSTKLIDALDPIDTPILIALDNTVARSAHLAPNVLQLIPNNALQAQAILSKVGGLLPEGEDKVNVSVYLWPPQNEFVHDLRIALMDKTSEAPNSRIALNPITVGKALKDIGANLTGEDILIYVGYYDGLKKLLALVKSAKIVLSDACNERRVEKMMADTKRTYYLSQSSFDASVYACQGYLSLTKVWLETIRTSQRLLFENEAQSFAARIQKDLETRFLGGYRFVGATNQSGGYIIRKIQSTEKHG